MISITTKNALPYIHADPYHTKGAGWTAKRFGARFRTINQGRLPLPPFAAGKPPGFKPALYAKQKKGCFMSSDIRSRCKALVVSSRMVMPNIGAFIAWGIITALFIPTGWLPNETLAAGRSDDHYLLPLLIGYTGGKLVGGERGNLAWSGRSPPWALSSARICRCFTGSMIAGRWAYLHQEVR